MPPAFFLDGEWFGMTPASREIKVLKTLRPYTTGSCSYKSPQALMTAGICTEDIMNAFQKNLLFPQEIESTQKYIARQSMVLNL